MYNISNYSGNRASNTNTNRNDGASGQRTAAPRRQLSQREPEQGRISSPEIARSLFDDFYMPNTSGAGYGRDGSIKSVGSEGAKSYGSYGHPARSNVGSRSSARE